ncbi:MAG: PepSY domain-containing protein [Actinobacteria bacterium]|nr:PepSY domain-containing protein [Actinomycetota bacterium]
MTRKKIAVAAVTVGILAAATGGIAVAGGVGDNDEALSGRALERATSAALAHTGGGRVTETEIGDSGAAYGVEVKLANGKQVEVELDENFKVIGQEADDDGPNDRDETGEQDD